jgi:hypothetical protein
MFNLGSILDRSILDRGPMHGQEDGIPDADVNRTMATPWDFRRR